MQQLSPQISVIVPVYQAEKYLASCLDSILNQTFQQFELLLIDDGSQDCSGKICDSYAKKDSRIQVFHQSNQGVATTRNFGIEHATGQYLAFVDSDDMIAPTYLEALLQQLSSQNTDAAAIALCRFQLMYDTHCETKEESLSPYPADNYSFIQLYLKPLVTGKMHGSICRILFPATLLKEFHIRFSDCKIAEDTLFLLEVLTHCKQVFLCDEVLYSYRQFEGSSSHRLYIQNYLSDRCKYIKKLNQILSAYPMQPEQFEWLMAYAFQFYRMLLYMNATAAPNAKDEIKNIDCSIFGRAKVSKALQKAFHQQLGKKHQILDFLIQHRLFFLVRLIRNHKRK